MKGVQAYTPKPSHYNTLVERFYKNVESAITKDIMYYC